MPLLRTMVEVRKLRPGFVVRLAGGTLEAAEEVVEVRMRAPRDAAPALRLELHERDLHGITPGGD